MQNDHRAAKPWYGYMTPRIAVGADKLMADLFLAAAAKIDLILRGLWAIPQLDTAVAGVLSARYDLYRTSAIGTGGTAASSDSATRDVGGGNFWKFDESMPALDANLTARVAPGGGATISRWLFPVEVATEETTASMGYLNQYMNTIPVLSDGGPKIIVRPGTGLLIKQGAVASVGAVGFLLAFETRPRF